MVSLDLTDNKPITPQKVAEVRAALDLERRQGDRRTEGRTSPGRRAIDRMAASPQEMDRLNRGPVDDEDHRDWENHGDE